jgi:hypothetical protein
MHGENFQYILRLRHQNSSYHDNKVGDLTVFHWNARSVRNKIEYLDTIFLGSSIVCITESHLIDKVSTQDILISGMAKFEMFSEGVQLKAKNNMLEI